MKKSLLAALLSLPLLASASTLGFNSVGNNFSFTQFGGNSAPDSNPVPFTGNRDVGQFGSFSINGAGGGTFSATFLGSESGYANRYVQFGTQVLNESTVGATVTSQILGPGLIDFGFYSVGIANSLFKNGDIAGSVLGFVVLKQYVQPCAQHQRCVSGVSSAGYNNHTTLGDFDFLIGFNDKAKVDADYDDAVIGIKFTPNAVPLPAALPLMATAIGLFGFGANRRRV